MQWIHPDLLSPVTGQVERFLFNACGEADGLVLTDGREVYLPPHLATQVLGAVRPGDSVTLHAVRGPRGDRGCDEID